MIIFENKDIETRSNAQNEDFSEGKTAKHVVEDETELANKLLVHAPYFDEVLDDNGMLIDIIPTPRPIEPVIEPEPTVEDYLLDLEYRTSILELGGLQR